MKILNLGCGTKISNNEQVINIDWSIYLRIKNNPFMSLFTKLLFKDSRLEKLNTLTENIMVYNLAKGIPFDTCSVDAVYHSHILEHLDRDVAKSFLTEIYRVLKPEGLHRIVVPDFEEHCRSYLFHITQCENDLSEIERHDSYIELVLEQSVRREAFGTSQQMPLRRFIENKILGDARKRGETHQWMYDKISIKSLLASLGYEDITIRNYNESSIPNWNSYGLDIDEHGNQYKPGSLYVEAKKSAVRV